MEGGIAHFSSIPLFSVFHSVFRSGAIMPVKKRKEVRNNVPSQPPVSEEYPVASGYAYYDQRGAPSAAYSAPYPASASAPYDGEEDPYANYPTEYPSTSSGYDYPPYKTDPDQYNHDTEIPYDLYGKVWKPKVTAAPVSHQDPSHKEESYSQPSAYKPVPAGPYKTVRPYKTVEPSKARAYQSGETPAEGQYNTTVGDQFKRIDPYGTTATEPYGTTATEPYGTAATEPYGTTATDPYGDPYEATEQPSLSYKSGQYNGGYAVSGESYYHDPPQPQDSLPRSTAPQSAPRSTLRSAALPQSGSRPTPPPQSAPRSVPLPSYGSEASLGGEPSR